MNSPSLKYPGFSIYLTVDDARAAIEFYSEAFGAEEQFRLIDPESDKIGHAELQLRGGLLMLADEYPGKNQSPATLGGTSARLSLIVENADQLAEKAAALGATIVMPPTDMFYGLRHTTLRDPFGHEWMVQHIIEEVSPEEMQRRWNDMMSGETPPESNCN